MRRHTFVIATLLLAIAAIHVAATEPAGAIDSKAAFARLKTLAGEWQADTSKGKTRLAYELIASGTSLVERETMDKMPPMLTVYHLDGNHLMLTHYCAMGNQPRMRAQSFDTKTGELRFQFLDAANLADGNADHMHNATIRFIDNDHFTADWEFYENGRRKSTEIFQYTRVR